MMGLSTGKSIKVTGAVALLGAAVLGGCAVHPAVASTPTTIQFWTISLHPTFDKYINSEIAQYQNSHPGVKVQWTDLPYDSIETKLLAGIASGNAPDVVNLNTEMALELAGKGALVDLNKAATPAQKNIYFKTLLDSAKLGSAVYAFPWYLTPDVLMYNKAIFKKAGLNPNKPPKTWDEVVKDAKIIKAKTGVYGFRPNINPITDFTEAGIPLLSKDKKHAAFNTPAGVKIFKYYGDLIKNDVVPHDSITKGYTQAIDDYQGGRLAMLITGPQFLSRVKTGAPDVYNNTMTAQVPSFGNVFPAPLMDMVVPSASSHQKEAVDFANYITNDKSQLAFDKLVAILPSTKKAAADPYFKKAGTTPEGKALAVSVKELGHAQDITLGVAVQNDLNKAITTEAQKVMAGQEQPAQALANAAKQWDVILSAKQ